jgi:dienelactone hydrolase
MCYDANALPPLLPADLAHRDHHDAGDHHARRDIGDDFPSPLRHAEQTRCPVLGLFGGEDELIPPELVSYPGAPHSFFDRAPHKSAEASGDAWRRVVGFLAGLESSAPGR